MSSPSEKLGFRAPKARLDPDLPAGTAVGEYRVKRKVAEGGMATVYAGIHPLIHKKVAIKVMRPVEHGDARVVERFIAEARTVNQIGHPNIVDAFAFGSLPDGRCYLVMDWLDGETLEARLRHGRIRMREGIKVLHQLVEALAAAHDKGIVHRDLKPANIHLARAHKRLAAKLLDFGIATLLVEEGRPDATDQRVFVGTPKYTSPEQAGGAAGNAASDVYSLGVTAFEMLVGRPPFVADTTSELLRMHLCELPPAPSTLWPEVPIQLERLLVQMLDKSPERRPTLAEVATRLDTVRSELDEDRRTDRDPTEVHAIKPRRRVWTRVALVAIAAAAGTAVAYWPRVEARWKMLTAPAIAEAPPSTKTVEPPRAIEGRRVVTPAAAPSPPAAPLPAPTAAGSVVVDVNVPSLIRVDGHVVGRGRRATVDVSPDVAHLVVVSSRHGTYRDKLVVEAGHAVELAVRLGAARPSVKRHHVKRPSTPPPGTTPSTPSPSNDPNYTLNPFASH